jgi:hypothetical protein
MLKENETPLKVILLSLVISFVGLILDGVRGAILGYIATLLVILIFWVFRKFMNQ